MSDGTSCSSPFTCRVRNPTRLLPFPEQEQSALKAHHISLASSPLHHFAFDTDTNALGGRPFYGLTTRYKQFLFFPMCSSSLFSVHDSVFWRCSVSLLLFLFVALCPLELPLACYNHVPMRFSSLLCSSFRVLLAQPYLHF